MRIFKSLFLLILLISLNSLFCQTITSTAILPNRTTKSKPPLTKSEYYQLKIDQERKTIKWADSLIIAGKAAVKQADSDIMMLENDEDDIVKEYQRDRRLSEKGASSGDKEVANKASDELKKMDAKFKADIKNLDNQIKANLKKGDTGQKNQVNGKEKKKVAQEELKKTKKALDEWLKKINK